MKCLFRLNKGIFREESTEGWDGEHRQEHSSITGNKILLTLWRSLWEILLETLPDQSNVCFFIQIFCIYLYWPYPLWTTIYSSPRGMRDIQLIPACKFQKGSAFFSTSEMPDKFSTQGCCQVWEHPLPHQKGKCLWMSRSGSGKEGGSREQSVLWRCLPPSGILWLQGWGAVSPRRDIPGVRSREKRSAFPLAVAAKGGQEPQGAAGGGTHGRAHWPWCVMEVYCPPSWWRRSFIQLEVKVIVSQASWLYWEWSLLVILQALESLWPIWHWENCEHCTVQPFNDGLGWLARKWGLCHVSYCVPGTSSPIASPGCTVTDLLVSAAGVQWSCTIRFGTILKGRHSFRGSGAVSWALLFKHLVRVYLSWTGWLLILEQCPKSGGWYF